MSEVAHALNALIGKVAENGHEVGKEGVVNRALIDALIATLLAKGVLSHSDFASFYRIGEMNGEEDFRERITKRLDAIKSYAKI